MQNLHKLEHSLTLCLHHVQFFISFLVRCRYDFFYYSFDRVYMYMHQKWYEWIKGVPIQSVFIHAFTKMLSIHIFQPVFSSLVFHSFRWVLHRITVYRRIFNQFFLIQCLIWFFRLLLLFFNFSCYFPFLTHAITREPVCFIINFSRQNWT